MQDAPGGALPGENIHTFDLFLSYDDPGLSIFTDWARLNYVPGGRVQVYPGDIRQTGWRGGAIQVLFLDLLKSVDIQDHVVRTFMPDLNVGALVIQQDYVHFAQWWIHIFMELFADHFEPIEYVFASTAVFRLERPLPDLRTWSLWGALSVEEAVRTHRQHLEKAPALVRPVLQVAHAQMLLDLGMPERADAALGEVQPLASDDPVLDFGRIAVANRGQVEAVLRARRAA